MQRAEKDVMATCFQYSVGTSIPKLLAGCAAASVILLGTFGVLNADSRPPPAATRKALGLVVTAWNVAVYETKDGKEECGNGFNLSSDEIWLNSLTPADRDRLTQHGTIETINPAIRRTVADRGPHGEDVCYFPTVVKDPPLKLVTARKSYGINLDGTTDGHATSKSCSHQKFMSLDGTQQVDNQMYRLMGCVLGWRSDGYIENNANEELRAGQNAVLIEITDIADLHDSPDVKVDFYLAHNPVVKSEGGKVLPFASYQTVDNYHMSTRGKIVDGVLTTAPIDAHFPLYANMAYAERYMREMQLRIKVAPDGRGAEGIVAGYYDFDSWWDYIRREGYLTKVGHFSCPALYAAAQGMKDGFPDPKTGECTAISTAFKIEAAAAFIIHPNDVNRDKTAEAEPPTRSASN